MFVGGVQAGLANPSPGAGINGAVAREMCASDWNASFGFVVGIETTRHYVAELVGFRETLASYRDGPKTPYSDMIKAEICVPDEVSMEDRVGMFCKFLQLNTDADTDKYSAYAAYTSAMNDAWPCKD